MKKKETATISIEQAIKKYGFIIHKTEGISMLPMLEEGKDLVRLVEVKDKSSLQKYDLPLFRREDGALILHRIIEVKNNYYITYGDNCKTFEKVPFKNIIAIAEGYYKGEKYISCNDESYLEYVNKRCSNIANRKIYTNITKEQRALVYIFGLSLAESPKNNIEIKDINWNKLFNIAEQHNISAFIYKYVSKTNCPQEILAKWKEKADMALCKEILFDAERQFILNEFEKNQVKYIPLKGIILKNFYPLKGIREFTDNDILIFNEDLEKANIVMEARGFKRAYTHDTTDCPYYKEPIFNFELHNRLFSEKFTFNEYFFDIWNNANKAENKCCEFKMKDEDFYIYIIAHFYKHYVLSGAGLKFFADLFYMQKVFLKSKDFDWEYVKNILTDMNIFDFEQKCTRILNDIVEICNLENENNDIIDKFYNQYNMLQAAQIYDMICYLLNSGAFGSRTTYAENMISEKGRIRYLISRIFPEYKIMKAYYKPLSKYPLLLPYYWIKRLVTALFSNSKKNIASTELKVIKNYKKS